MTSLRYGASTHQGRVRPTNQDALHAGDWLFVVADGMGGHRAGETAARITAESLGGGSFTSLDDLVGGVEQANARVVERARGDAELEGMGTTVCALLVSPEEAGAVLVNVGDSRVYRWRDEALEQLTVDHSYVADLVRQGALSPAQAEVHPYRNMLTRAIGIGDDVDVDAWELDIRPGDRYLLCSDGLFNELSDDDIADVLAAHTDPGAAARHLIDGANDQGGRDNVTVVLVDIGDDDDDDGGEASALATPVPDADSRLADTRPIAVDELPDAAVGTTVFAPSLDVPDRDDVSPTEPVPVAATPSLPGTATVALPGSPPRDDVPAPSGRRLPVWLAVATSVLIVALVAAALTGIGLWARSGHHIGLAGDEVVVMQGREGGLWWFEPTVAARTGVGRADLTDEQLAGLDGRSVAGEREGVALVESAAAETGPSEAGPSEAPAGSGTPDGGDEPTATSAPGDAATTS